MAELAAGARPPSLPGGLRILLADADIVVVDKPSGMPSVPARTPLDPADVAAVLEPHCGILEAAHRLDRDTSGLLVLARSREMRARLGRSFEDGLVEKRYLAIVHGRLPTADGEVCQPLADDLARPPRKRVDPILGRRATTRWRALDVVPAAAAAPDATGPLTLVELQPVTGRSHQLRVHLAWLGCPILGDRLYGPTERPAVPLALHAASISLPHPRDGRRLAIVSPPRDGCPWRFLAACRGFAVAYPTAAASGGSRPECRG